MATATTNHHRPPVTKAMPRMVGTETTNNSITDSSMGVVEGTAKGVGDLAAAVVDVRDTRVEGAVDTEAAMKSMDTMEIEVATEEIVAAVAVEAIVVVDMVEIEADMSTNRGAVTGEDPMAVIGVDMVAIVVDMVVATGEATTPAAEDMVVAVEDTAAVTTMDGEAAAAVRSTAVAVVGATTQALPTTTSKEGEVVVAAGAEAGIRGEEAEGEPGATTHLTQGATSSMEDQGTEAAACKAVGEEGAG